MRVIWCGRQFGKRPIKRHAVHTEKVGDMLAGLAVVDECAGVFDLLRRQFALTSEFHAAALRGFHSGAGPFTDEAAFKLGE